MKQTIIYKGSRGMENKTKSCILLYHGVTNCKSYGIENFSGKHINVNDFEEQMKHISEHCIPIKLKDVGNITLKQLQENNYVVVTFDDSYKNVYDNAMPILKKYNIPATFFISTGYVGTNRLYWTDELEHIVNYTSKNMIGFNGYLYFIDDDKRKVEFLLHVKSFLKRHNNKFIINYIEELKGELGFSDCSNIENYKHMTWNNVIDISKDDLFDIGGHTVNHEIMSQLDDIMLEREVVECLGALENKANIVTSLFSYPEGQAKHYNNKVISCLKENDITICPSAIYGYVDGSDDSFNLKRVMVGFGEIKFPFYG